ncbi:MAG: hypothetical protein ACTSP7_08885 [Candidatus Heimdallarchaeota archaeon]
MKNSKILFSIICSIFLLSHITNGLPIFAEMEKDTINAFESPAPVIDGIIDVNEWNLGMPVSILLYDLINQSNTLEIEIIALYSSSLKLYLAIIVPDVVASGDDNIAIVFKTNESEPLIKGGGVIPFTFGNHHDIKSYFVTGNLSLDCYTLDVGLNWASDTPVSGINDLTAAHVETGTHVTYEFAFPMDSGDIQGYDTQLAVGNGIEIFSLFIDDDSGTIYSQCRETDADFDYNILVIRPYSSPTPIKFGTIIVGFFSITIAILVTTRKRK